MLPKTDLPLFTTTLPISKKQVTFRAYTVREERLLLIAKETGDPAQIPLTVHQIIANCTDIKDPRKLNLVDRDFLLLQFRSKINGNIESLGYVCKHDLGEIGVCNSPIVVDIDLDKIEFGPLETTVMLDSLVGLSFHFPSVADDEQIKNLSVEFSVDKTLQAAYILLDSIFDSNVTTKADITFTEFEDWLLSRPAESFDKIDAFLSSLPELYYKATAICPKCKTNHEIILRGISDFFP